MPFDNSFPHWFLGVCNKAPAFTLGVTRELLSGAASLLNFFWIVCGGKTFLSAFQFLRDIVFVSTPDVQIKEYKKYNSKDVLRLYDSVGWSSYTDDLVALENGLTILSRF